ncbi:MAG: FAD-dependent oxidoreductase [Halarcobacter sp.]
MISKEYDYVIIGAGIAGCSVAHFLTKYSNSILLIDRNCDIAQGASGAAGAFLSPLLGKPNKFKDLVTTSLKFSTKLYKEYIFEHITNCGVVRIPKNKEDRVKFENYKPYMDFEFKQEGEGYFFEIGSQVNSYDICKYLSKDVEKSLKYEVKKLEKIDNTWQINGEINAKNIILTTGADISLINEKYFNIRAVWGEKIDIKSSTNTKVNYHKECSLSHSRYDEKENINYLSIGATHNRIDCNFSICNHCYKKLKLSEQGFDTYNKELINSDTNKLLKLANDIKKLDDVEVIDIKIGARASSVDYFPMVGKLVDSQKTLQEFPHLVNGSFIKDKMLSETDNLYVLNGVGGRGYVLSPYLAYNLVENIINKKPLQEDIISHRLFKRWVKRVKNT